MTVALRNSPPASAFLGDLASFYHWDSYEAPLRRDDLVMHEIYLALFAHPPRGFTALLVLRDRIVAPFGLRPSGAAERKAHPDPERDSGTCLHVAADGEGEVREDGHAASVTMASAVAMHWRRS